MITGSYHASGLPGQAAAQRELACGDSPPAAARQAGRVGDQDVGLDNSMAEPVGNARPMWPAGLDRTAGPPMTLVQHSRCPSGNHGSHSW